ncbi:M48 family metallopeptidase [Rugamonas rivuli]|uniref:M48 family metallopeptidase n=1 Tax=Rugamonas rivuli TaxID=2743358 RepID=UPI001C2D203C|nr:M48 family metallopeptidase [Rugamonas rivuli]
MSVFVLLYFALAGWFLYTGYRLIFLADIAGKNALLGYLMAACALFLAFFMVKAIFSVRSAKFDGLLELTAEQQPRLFAFLYDLADAAGAPRPHKVFLSERVNAAVFYDLSLFNLIFPSKKNLEIGLGLVNVLNLGELRAVLAHEFGHFAQRSMAVGRWVYVAQQITGHLVSRRDKIDDFLAGLANVDIRVRAGVAVIQLIIWSIRSLVETAFHAVVVMQRALSREMEMQADLVAVSLTGSDALVHALHRLQAADDAWDRAVQFSFSEKSDGKPVRDVFAVQTHVLQRMADILDDDSYGSAPPLPQDDPAQHRVFKAELAQPPRMWQTHPQNHEREANAKRIYVAARIDGTSAWSLFEAPQQLREQMTAKLMGNPEQPAPELEESLRRLGKIYRREHFKQRYCGIYFGRALTRHVGNAGQLRDPSHPAAVDELAQLYPDTLKELVQRQRMLDGEAGQLRALIAGVMSAKDGVVRLRGEEFKLSQLPAALKRVEAELEEVHGRLRAHDFLCRSWHQGAAAQLGGGWREYLDGLLALVHYAEHGEADIRDALGLLRNVIAVVTATGKTKSEEVTQVVNEANRLHSLLERIHRSRDSVMIDRKLAERLELEGGWSAMLGDFKLPMASHENINDWIAAIDGWVQQFAGALGGLRAAALEQLLVTEALVARHARAQSVPQAAPEPSQAPEKYARHLHGDTRPRQTRLGWWARFQRADGILPGMARLAVAGGIVATVLGLGMVVNDEATLHVYNGLGRTVVVKVDGHTHTLAPFTSVHTSVSPLKQLQVEARTAQGEPIETFLGMALDIGADGVYNIAAAAPLAIQTVSYGTAVASPVQLLGAPRWLESHAHIFFVKAPDSVKTSGGATTRSVLDGGGALPPAQQLAMLADEGERQRLIQLRARWDDMALPYAVEWLKLTGSAAVLEARLKLAPDDLVLLRAQQELAGDVRSAEFCAPYLARSAQHPDNADFKYLALRCPPDSPESDRQMLAAYARWPDHPWLAYASSTVMARSGDPLSAIPALKLARAKLPQMAPEIALDLARLLRLRGQGDDLSALAADSPRLKWLLDVEQESGLYFAPSRAYLHLRAGRLDDALANAKSDEWLEAHVMRLVAASDGADAESIKRALNLPLDRGTDPGTALLNVALAMKTGADIKTYVDTSTTVFSVYHPPLLAFLQQLQQGRSPEAAEQRLSGLPVEVRAYAYCAGIALIGPKAPASWRRIANGVLFASERPYFKA